MRYYIDLGAGMEMRPYDVHAIVGYLQGFGGQRVCLERKFGSSNMPEVVCFDDYRNVSNYPECATLHEWLWNNGLTLHFHWKEIAKCQKS
jgi:hypothetical protein